MNILIVDDESANRTLLNTILSRLGPCATAADGEEAVERFQAALIAAEPFDLVCLDIAMPRMDGLQALRAMRDLEKEWAVPWGGRAVILMITSRDEPDEVLAAFRDGGCHGYINKPVTPASLLERIEEHLSTKVQIRRDSAPRRSPADFIAAQGYTLLPSDNLDERIGRMVTRFSKRWPRRDICTTPIQEVRYNFSCDFSQAIDAAILRQLSGQTTGRVTPCVGTGGTMQAELDLILSGVYGKTDDGIELTLTLRDGDGLFVDSVRGLLVKRGG